MDEINGELLTSVCDKAAGDADTVFIAVTAHGGDVKCGFYAFTRTARGFERAFACEGYLGRGGVCAARDKREGDGRTPDGVYGIGEAFGILDAPEGAEGYTKLTDDDCWDSDPESDTYNTHVKASDKSGEWLARGQYERLSAYPGAYDYAAMINYNVPPVPGRGSAIFLHCGSPGGNGSAGCVCIPTEYMKKALRFLNGKARVVIAARVEELTKII